MNRMTAEEFKREEARKQLSLMISGGLAGLAALFLFVIFGGETTSRIRDITGLSYFMADESGVYANCGKSHNRDNKFCSHAPAYKVVEPKHVEKPRAFERPDSLPFSLSEH